MGLKDVRPKTKTQKELKKAQTDLLDAQAMAATLYEKNIALNSRLLDTQEMLASMVENGAST